MDNNSKKNIQDLKKPNVGLGIDIVEIDRIKRIIDRTPCFIERVYTKSEIDYCKSKSNPIKHFSSCFAAKEAVLKALGVGFLSGAGPRNVELMHNSNGCPYIILSGGAKDVATKLEIADVPISLSFSHTEAISCAIALKKKSFDESSECEDVTLFNTPEQINRRFKELKELVE